MSQAKKQQTDGQFRERLSALLSRRLDPLASELSSLQSTLDAVCNRLVEQARASSEDEIDAIDHEIRQRIYQSEERLQRDTDALRAECARSIRGDHASLNAAIAEIDRQRNQAGVLGATVQAAAAFAERVSLFVLRGGNLVGWRGRGFETNESDEPVASLSIPVSERMLVNDALSARQTVSHTGADEAGYLSFLGQHRNERTTHAVAVPLVVREKAAAVLYADTTGENRIDPHPLEALLRVASMAIELLPLRRSTEGIRSAVQPTFVTSPLHEAAEPTGALPSTVTNRLEPPAPETEAQPQEEKAAAEPGENHEASPSDTPSTEATVAPEIEEAVTAPIPDPREHLNAQRFARFLVGEIKLYQTSRVTEGCRRADLYDRLRDEIERSRKLYERHVPSQITAEFDYFYHELVSTLAEGDETKLGRNFPGPRA